MSMTVSAVSPTKVKYRRGENPNSRKNLIPFKPGQNGDTSGNGVSLTQELKIRLRKSPELRAQIIDAIINGAILREPTPFKELWDRHDGKLTDKVALLGDITIRIVEDDD